MKLNFNISLFSLCLHFLVVHQSAKAQGLSRETDTLLVIKGAKIAIPGHHGISFNELNEIVFAEASNNYSRIVLSDKRVFTVSKTLKDVQDVLEGGHFLRVHRQYIINLNRVKQFNRNESILTMDNGEQLPIARNQKEKLVEKYGWL